MNAPPVWRIGIETMPAIAVADPTVWLLDLNDVAVRALAATVAPLPGEALTFARRPDAGERHLRRRLTRLLLATAAGVPADTVAIIGDGAGAPVVERPAGWHLSVAARWPLFAIAVAREPIGIDVEVADGPLPADLLTATERGCAGAADRIGLWAAKEAHAKWTGRPRDLDPADIETSFARIHAASATITASGDRRAGLVRRDDGTVISRFGTTRCWLYEAGDHAAAVCTAA